MSKEKKNEKVISGLIKEHDWEMSKKGRFCRWVMFKLGFSQCRYCVYCKAEGDKYRGIREGILLDRGECDWSKGMVSAQLLRGDLRKYHRCPGFVAMLYNYKGYAINPEKVKEITSERFRYFLTWIGWLVAVLVAVISSLR